MRSARYLTRMLTAVRLVFASLVAFIGPRAALAAEILALRHQLGVLERSSPPRLPLTCWDRALWAFLIRHWSGWKDSLVLVKPETVIRLAPPRVPPLLAPEVFGWPPDGACRDPASHPPDGTGECDLGPPGSTESS